MIRTCAALAVLVLAACTPQLSGPEAAVNAIYKPLVDSKGDTGTDAADLPLTMDLALKIQELETRAEERIFDFDLAGNCQDCTDFANLKISTPTDPSLAPRDGHSFVEASFTLFGNEQKSMFWDLMQVDGVWQVDNIFTEGFDLRLILDDMLANQAAADDEPEVGMMQCMAMLRLHADALQKATPAGDTAAYDAAFASYRALVELAMTPDELAQFLASSVAVLDDTPTEQVAGAANACVASAPAPVPAQ